jgi:hypothetical protein
VNGCVAAVREPERKVRVLLPIWPNLPSPVKVTSPFVAASVVVPVKSPESMLTVTESVAVVTTLPDASAMLTFGGVVKFARFTKPAAGVVSRSWVAAPGVTEIG